MANALYNFAREGFLEGAIQWTVDDIKAILIDTAFYSVDLNNDKYLSDVNANARVIISGVLTGKTSNNGIADAIDLIIPAVTGPSVEAIIVFRDTGTENTSELIIYIDTANTLPIYPNGSQIIIQWSDDSNKIFKL